MAAHDSYARNTPNGSISVNSVIFTSSVDLFTDTGALLYNTNTLNGLLTLGTSNGLQLYTDTTSLTIGNAGTLFAIATLAVVF